MGKILKKSVSQNVFKTYGWNLKCVIKVVNPFIYIQNFVPYVSLPLPLGYMFKHFKIFKCLNNFRQILHWAFCQRGIFNLFKRSCIIKEVGCSCPYMVKKHLKIFSRTLGPVVQSVVSLTNSLRVISSTVLADLVYNNLIFFAEKM